jgi:DNA-binding transcriptional regulator YhcF (GntR family)
MAALSIDGIFDAAVRIQLQEGSVTVSFRPDTIMIKFPTTRRLAEFLEVPHYYVLPYFATMEQEDLVTRAERVGIMTTAKGSRKMIGIMADTYRKETESIVGTVLFEELLRRSTFVV